MSIGELTFAERKTKHENIAEANEETEFDRKDNGLAKRCVVLADQSNMSVVLTLWGQTAETAFRYHGKILVMKHIVVSHYCGRTLKFVDDTLLMVGALKISVFFFEFYVQLFIRVLKNCVHNMISNDCR